MPDPSIAESLEQIVFVGVAMTTVAIASARPGLDLTFPQWRVVVILGDAPQGVRISEVARRIGVTLPATSRQLRRLAERGLVTITPDDRDRRAAIARLSESGVQAREAIIEHRRAQIEALAGSLESDPVTRRELGRVAAAVTRSDR